MATGGVFNGGSSSSCHFETNWRVAAGSLQRTVVFESSSEDSPIDGASLDSVNDAAIPVVLKPEAADSGPCEFKIRFLQKHEIRQIYIRSTARVYEVYYARSWQSDNEYLCTVRCSIAERDEQVLQAFDTKESAESTDNSSGDLKEEKLTADGDIGTSEDDWVEVKVLGSSFEPRINSLSNASTGRDVQDFYEATAEISNSDPCTSITLRFLSLQNKSCVCIDEVYVFTDPISAIESDHQSQDGQGSAGSPLMAMLIPTLLQLSKSGMSQIQGQQVSSDLLKGNKSETGSKATDLTDLTGHLDEKESGDQQYVDLQRVDGSTAEQAETQLCNKILNGDKSDDPLVKNDPSYGHVEEVLEQLASRVGRIEEVCLRFEENMLKPLNSMEMRIQRVEQQLEVLVNSSQHSGLPLCTRFCAPSFSCNSNSSSFHNDGCDYQPCRAPESDKKELTSGDLLNASDGISRSANVPHLFPSLVVSAPDFSCEDDLDDDGLKSLNSPRENKKKPLIDNVLAASLSGFLSESTGNLSVCKKTPFISCGTGEIISDEVPSENVRVEITTDINAKEEPSRYTQVLAVMAPEFTSEENAGEELLNYTEFASVVFPKFASKVDERVNDATLEGTAYGCSVVNSDLSDINRDRLVSNQASILHPVASSLFAEANSIIPDDIPSEVVDEQNHVSERSNTGSFAVPKLDGEGDEAEDTTRSNVCQTISGSDQREPLTNLFPEKNYNFGQFSGHKTDVSPIAVGAAVSNTECAALEGPDKGILQNLSESSSASLVDFGIPIIDVKFAPCEDSRTQFPLEALLHDAMDINVKADPLQENGVEDEYAQETNFIDINEEGETGDSLTSNSPVFDLGALDMAHSSIEPSVLGYSYSTCEQDTIVSLI